MKYLMLINLGPDGRDWRSLSQEEQQKLVAGWQAINQAPGVTPGNQLQPPETATTVRLENGEARLTDGPIGASDQAVDGYLLYEADDLDAAIELAARIPALASGGAVEVRPFAPWNGA
jgi:hypothetical protein